MGYAHWIHWDNSNIFSELIPKIKLHFQCNEYCLEKIFLAVLRRILVILHVQNRPVRWAFCVCACFDRGGIGECGFPFCRQNLRTAPQSKDQELTRGNLALSKSVETGNPVRVIRGYKLRSPFAPDEGYRYDGSFLFGGLGCAHQLIGHKVLCLCVG